MKKIKFLMMVAIMFVFITGVSMAKSESEFISEIRDNIENIYYRIDNDADDALRDEAEAIKDDINSLSDYEVKKELAKEVAAIIDEIDKILLGSDLDHVIKNVGIFTGNGDLELRLPQISSRYRYEVYVKDNDYDIVMLNMTAEDGGNYSLPALKEKTNIYYSVNIVDGNDEIKKTKTQTVSFNDTKAPIVDCIYVVNGKLKVEAHDNYRFAEDMFIFEVDEKIYEKDSYLKIKEFPTRVYVSVRDYFGNTSYKKTIYVKEDNKVYYGKATDEIQEEIDDNKKSDYEEDKYYENMVIAEYGKELDYMKVFDDVFEDVFGKRYDEDDIKVEYSTLSYDKKKKKVSLDKKGFFEMRFKEDGEDEIAYCYITVAEEDGDIESDIQRVENNIPYYLTSDKVDFRNYVKLIPRSTSDSEDMNSNYVVIEAEGRLYPFSTKFTLNNQSIYEIKVYNIGRDRFEHEFKYEKLTSGNTDLFDTQNHWARSSINNLVRKGVIKGYSDRTFRPNNNITVREFMVLMTRMNPMKKRENLDSGDSYASRYDWARFEIMNVLSKMTYMDAARSGLIYRLDDPIRRDEAAFLIAHYYDFVERNTRYNLTDTYTSQFSQEVQKVVSNNIMKGYKDNTFRPHGNLTRAEAVTTLTRLIGK